LGPLCSKVSSICAEGIYRYQSPTKICISAKSFELLTTKLDQTAFFTPANLADRCKAGVKTTTPIYPVRIEVFFLFKHPSSPGLVDPFLVQLFPNVFGLIPKFFLEKAFRPKREVGSAANSTNIPPSRIAKFVIIRRR